MLLKSTVYIQEKLQDFQVSKRNGNTSAEIKKNQWGKPSHFRTQTSYTKYRISTLRDRNTLYAASSSSYCILSFVEHTTYLYNLGNTKNKIRYTLKNIFQNFTGRMS